MASDQLELSRIDGRVVLAVTLVTIVGAGALLARIGADSQWLVALGRIVAARRAIPAGLPFAAPPTTHWPNPLVLAELIFAGLHAALGIRGLMLAQLAAVAGGVCLLARDARAGGAGPVGISAALLTLLVGAITSLVIVRVQLFSLLLFPMLLALLRRDARAPSARIWWVVPLLALWSNLHGAALVGLGATLVYLALGRGRRDPWRAAAVSVAAVAALWVTPAGIHTIAYYHGVLTGATVRRAAGEWGPLSPTSPFDVLLILAGALLLWRALAARPSRWEAVVLVVLAALTVHAARDGVWLLMVAVGPAARRLDPGRSLRWLTPVLGIVGTLALIVGLVREPAVAGAPPATIARAVALAHGSPVLADGAIPEQVAVAGGRIWAGDPIDAFPRRVQATYLDWLAGTPAGAGAVTPAIRVVLVARGSATAALMGRMAGFAPAWRTSGVVVYARRSG